MCPGIGFITIGRDHFSRDQTMLQRSLRLNRKCFSYEREPRIHHHFVLNKDLILTSLQFLKGLITKTGQHSFLKCKFPVGWICFAPTTLTKYMCISNTDSINMCLSHRGKLKSVISHLFNVEYLQMWKKLCAHQLVKFMQHSHISGCSSLFIYP